MTTRVLPPNSVALQTLTVNGRTYTGAPGAVLDVPDQDAAVLTANTWIRVAKSGPTTGRPTVNVDGGSVPLSQSPGYQFLDTTLGYLIVFDGLAWRNPATGAVV